MPEIRSSQRLEDTEYGKHSIDTLVKIANAFDCALFVKLIPYSRLAAENDDLSPDALYASPYVEDSAQLLYGSQNDQLES